MTIETATLVQVIIYSAFVIGPMVGGYLMDLYDAQNACLYMAVIGINLVVLYLLAAIFVHCY